MDSNNNCYYQKQEFEDNGCRDIDIYSHCTVHFNVKYKKRYLCATFIFDVSQTYGAIFV